MLDQYQKAAALAAFDALNAQDPRTTEVAGEKLPYELVYGRRMSETLAVFAPDSSPALQLAARAQHLERWKIPRNQYPQDRVGYLKWRNDLKGYHAERAVNILRMLNVAEDLSARVAFLLQKKQLRKDPETQTLEDVICLVFLQHYAADFAGEHPPEKVVDILRKTWGKMSAAGQAAALNLDLEPAVAELVGKAVNEGE